MFEHWLYMNPLVRQYRNVKTTADCVSKYDLISITTRDKQFHPKQQDRGGYGTSQGDTGRLNIYGAVW